jgi:hypothetical protein
MSFPVIHELRGEYSPLFYVLKGQLEVARTRAALDEFEMALRSQSDELAEQECKKLRLLVARRWKLDRLDEPSRIAARDCTRPGERAR